MDSAHAVTWDKCSQIDWLSKQDVKLWKTNFETNGFLIVNDFLDEKSLNVYKDIYQKILDGRIDTKSHRNDLGAHDTRKQKELPENICQVMWPSTYVPGLQSGPIHQRARQVAQAIYGPDMEFDFDMLIAKAAHADTPMPWHSDEAYWPDMPDKRAMSFWVPMDDVTVDNGCMWFVPGSHKQDLRQHHPVREGHHTITCKCTEKEGVPQPIMSGSCTIHHGRTLHYTRGNTTERPRRAYIVNFRPKHMIQWERARNFDHGKKGIDQVWAKDVTTVG